MLSCVLKRHTDDELPVRCCGMDAADELPIEEIDHAGYVSSILETDGDELIDWAAPARGQAAEVRLNFTSDFFR